MIIAVPYENGQIWQHFGRTEQFKLYTVADGHVVSAQVVPMNGAGHESLAGVLKMLHVDTTICGGMGMGMQNALRAQGIEILPGVVGSADAAVEDYLAGRLVTNENAVHACGGHHSHF